MELMLYSNFAKRKNSTKRPTGGTKKEVWLKESCSIENPVFMIDGINLEWNYCKFADHFYFIDNITLSNNNIYELQCSQDVLATYRNDIGSYTAFVERSASEYDEFVNDNYLSTTQEIVNDDVKRTSLGYSSTGCYILRTVSNEGLNLYAFSPAAMPLIGAIFNEGTYGFDDLTNLINHIGLSIVNANDYLGGLTWVPYAYDSLGGSEVHRIAIGFWRSIQLPYTSEIPAPYKIPSNQWSKFTPAGVNLTRPTNVYEDFRKANPNYSTYSLFLPGVGLVEINSLDASADGELNLTSTVDLFNGSIVYTLRHIYAQSQDTVNIIASWSGQIGIDVPLGYSSENIGGFIQTAVGTAASIAVGVATSGASAAAELAVAGTAVTGTVSAVNTLLQTQSSISNGSGNKGILQMYTGAFLRCVNYGSKDFPDVEIGRPLYEHKQLSTLSGFIKCGGASIQISGLGNDKDAVNSYLNSGFYFE